MPDYALNRTITQAAIEQAAIGQTDIQAATAGLLIYVVSFSISLSAAGTITFNEGTGPTALTGVMPVAANGNVSFFGNGLTPILQTKTVNAKLGLVTTGVGATAHGWIRYFLAP